MDCSGSPPSSRPSHHRCAYRSNHRKPSCRWAHRAFLETRHHGASDPILLGETDRLGPTANAVGRKPTDDDPERQCAARRPPSGKRSIPSSGARTSSQSVLVQSLMYPDQAALWGSAWAARYSPTPCIHNRDQNTPAPNPHARSARSPTGAYPSAESVHQGRAPPHRQTSTWQADSKFHPGAASPAPTCFSTSLSHHGLRE